MLASPAPRIGKPIYRPWPCTRALEDLEVAPNRPLLPDEVRCSMVPPLLQFEVVRDSNLAASLAVPFAVSRSGRLVIRTVSSPPPGLERFHAARSEPSHSCSPS